ncbi:MAG TPA: APC family permease [Stellaceae bacterium]|nr:APC family permease [Stellaceae bacterium]
MTHSYTPAVEPAHDFRLAKVLGVLAVTASAVAAEYGAGINFVSTQSLAVYPGIRGLVPLAMFVTGILMLPKTYLFVMFSRVMPRAGSKYVWIARSLGVPIGFLVTFLWWATGPAGAGVLAFAFGTFLGQAVLGLSPALGAALLSPGGHLLCGLAAIWTTYAVNAAGVHRYGLFVTVLLFVIVATALVICAIGLSTSQAVFVAAASKLAKVSLAPPAAAPSGTAFDFVAVCSLFVFAYAGLGAGPALGGEVGDPHRKLPRGIIYGFVVALVLFTGVAVALFHAAPWWAVVGLIKAGKANYATAPGLVGLVAPNWVSVALNFAVALIVGKTLAPGFMVASRFAFAYGQDRMLPAVFAETSKRKVPLAGLVLHAVLSTAFLAQAVYVGWAMGVAVRSIAVLLVWLALAVGVLNLKLHPRWREAQWAAPILAQPLAIATAIVSIVIAVPLIASIAIVPHTALIFQPLFQGAVVLAIGLVCLGFAGGYAKARGDSFGAIALRVPVE